MTEYTQKKLVYALISVNKKNRMKDKGIVYCYYSFI